VDAVPKKLSSRGVATLAQPVSDDGYVIEDLPEGRTLVVTDRWTEAAEEAIQRGDVEAVWLNYARGYCEPDLSFVADWPIRRLLVLDRSITDLSPLARLGSTLEDLSFQAAPGTPIDLATLPRLQAVAAAWDDIRETLHAPEYLRRLIVFDFDGSDLEPLAVQPSLQTIQLKVAHRLETLDSIANFPTLTGLKVAAAPTLNDLDAVSSSRSTLRDLDLESCADVYDIEALSTLSELRYLGLNDCGLIPSIKPIASLTLLTTFHAWGSTRVEDADLSPLLLLARLQEIRMRDRRAYRPSLTEVKKQLGCT
jgi:hypothetical protein